jgi:glutamate dehydrogenase
VLRSNYLQTQAISMMEEFSVSRMGSKKHFINVLQDQGLLDRELEFLPDDEELDERRRNGEGLTRPELSVLLSYSKITLYQQLLASEVPEDAWLRAEAIAYFPEPLRNGARGHGGYSGRSCTCVHNCARGIRRQGVMSRYRTTGQPR